MSINKRILELIDSLEGGSQKGFASKIGLAPSSVNGIVGTRGSDPSAKILNSVLLAYKNINANWLITGNGNMFLSENESKKSENIKAIEVVRQPAHKGNSIPLIGFDVAAGFGTAEFSINDQDIQAFYAVPDFTDIDFMIRVKGNSMYPKYSSGDIIACRKIRESQFIQWNKCHVVATREQGLLVKRLKKSLKENHVIAVSDNQEYDPFEIPKDEITGIALVIGVIRLE